MEEEEEERKRPQNNLKTRAQKVEEAATAQPGEPATCLNRDPAAPIMAGPPPAPPPQLLVLSIYEGARSACEGPLAGEGPRLSFLFPSSALTCSLGPGGGVPSSRGHSPPARTWAPGWSSAGASGQGCRGHRTEEAPCLPSPASATGVKRQQGSTRPVVNPARHAWRPPSSGFPREEQLLITPSDKDPPCCLTDTRTNLCY